MDSSFRPAGTDDPGPSEPAAFRRSMSDYRHGQLAAGLAAHRRYRHEPLTVAVTGAGGLVGRALTSLLATGGHHVVRLVRRAAETAGERTWQPEEPAADLLAGVDAVVHLAGAPLTGRNRESVRDSRIAPTRALAELAARTPDGPGVFVSASAVAYYGPGRGDEQLTEESERGQGFLADVVAGWEAATEPASAAGLRVVRVRTGLVLSPRGGLLRLQYPLFAAGLGSPAEWAGQWLPWLGVDDLTDVYLRALTDTVLSGPVNAVNPEPVRYGEFARTLGAVLNRPTLPELPPGGPRLLLGQDGTRELAVFDQHATPRRLTGLGHEFRHPGLAAALRHLLGVTTEPAGAGRTSRPG